MLDIAILPCYIIDVERKFDLFYFFSAFDKLTYYLLLEGSAFASLTNTTIG